MSSIVNKVKDALHSDNKKTSQPEGTHGPHSSRAANAADPRVDSDRDHRAAGTTGAYNTGTTGTTGTTGAYNTGTTGTTGTTGNTFGSTTTGKSNLPEGAVGPHSSRLANAADPRVDSDLDNSRTAGRTTGTTGTTGTLGNTGRTTGTTGTTGVTGSNTYGTSGTTGVTGSNTYGTSELHTQRNPELQQSSGVSEGTFGPHSSSTANRLDPRVDSDADRSRNMGFNSQGTSTTTGTSSYNTTGKSDIPEGTYGHHNSRLANAADPRIDSDLDNTRQTRSMGTTGTTGSSVGGTGAMGSSTYATGQAPNTAGPHKSDMMNKIDPRVDSDLDGSKTLGQDKTFQSNTYSASKDPTDAAQVPPSVLQKHVGAPAIAHDDHSHGRESRHSVSHQEQHRGF